MQERRRIGRRVLLRVSGRIRRGRLSSRFVCRRVDRRPRAPDFALLRRGRRGSIGARVVGRTRVLVVPREPVLVDLVVLVAGRGSSDREAGRDPATEALAGRRA